MTLFVSYFSKSEWCGWRSLPPGFLFPVKEQVACMKDLTKDLLQVLFLSISDGYLTRGFTNLKKTYIM